MKAARIIFRVAGTYGVLVMFPLYFMEARLGSDYPPAITHPEYYYSFVGVTLVWQILFFLVANDPVRYRPVMLMCILEKLSLVPTFLILSPAGRFPQFWLPLMAIDHSLGALFYIAYRKTPRNSS
jgi:hypothetical protein